MKPTKRIKNNHYVPCMYLKRFASRPGWIYRYDLLVPNANCPIWVEKPIDRVASTNDLYTSLEQGVEVDTYEKWLNSEYETPAEEAIDRAVTGRCLIRFVAAQDVRTPARLVDLLARWGDKNSDLMQSTLDSTIDEIKSAKAEGRTPRELERIVEPGFPMRVIIQPSSEDGMVNIRVETVPGRSLWIWSQRHLLNGIAQHLHEHQWTILTAPDNVSWCTSDSPVVRLNFHADQSYDFEGGWGSPGTEIFMSLDPKHLVYTQIGHKRLPRGTIVQEDVGTRLGKFIVEHAFRHIFSPVAGPTITALRRRNVDLGAYQLEKAEWTKWAENQANAELDLNPPLAGG